MVTLSNKRQLLYVGKSHKYGPCTTPNICQLSPHPALRLAAHARKDCRSSCNRLLMPSCVNHKRTTFVVPWSMSLHAANGFGGRCAQRRRPRVVMSATPPGKRRDWQMHEDADVNMNKNGQEEDEVPLELVEGFLDNARIRPKIDLDANEYMLLWKLRRMLHEDDFNRIFDKRDQRIGDF